MARSNNPVVFFCVLNWGLGHATRSIPIISELLNRGCKVVIASDGRAAHLLRNEFPELDFFEVSGYKVSYPFKSMFFNLLYQWPRIVWAMIAERIQVAREVKKYHPDIIISDNRYGCYHPAAFNVCITHQINPPTSTRLFDTLGRWCSLLLLKNFNRVWIPDDPEKGPINGKMVDRPPRHARFIGFISRFEASTDNQKPSTDVLAVLSGPEPARSRFEVSIIQQLLETDYEFKIVRGITEGFQKWHQISEKGRMIDFLTSSELENEINKARFVVSRSGFTSLMDYLVMGVKAIVVPTPGQYEQEYLADHLPPHAMLVGQLEEELDILAGCEKLEQLTKSEPYQNDRLTDAINRLPEMPEIAHPSAI